MIRLVTLAAAAWPAAAAAQEVGPCDFRASAAAVIEPWEAHSRSFAEGAVRLALMDAIEPGAGPVHVLVLSPPYGMLGDRQCRIVSYRGGMGFADADFAALSAGYDPATGLTFRLPVEIFTGDEGFAPRDLVFTVNQATGAIAARFE